MTIKQIYDNNHTKSAYNIGHAIATRTVKRMRAIHQRLNQNNKIIVKTTTTKAKQYIFNNQDMNAPSLQHQRFLPCSITHDDHDDAHSLMMILTLS